MIKLQFLLLLSIRIAWYRLIAPFKCQETKLGCGFFSGINPKIRSRLFLTLRGLNFDFFKNDFICYKEGKLRSPITKKQIERNEKKRGLRGKCISILRFTNGIQQLPFDPVFSN